LRTAVKKHVTDLKAAMQKSGAKDKVEEAKGFFERVYTKIEEGIEFVDSVDEIRSTAGEVAETVGSIISQSFETSSYSEAAIENIKGGKLEEVAEIGEKITGVKLDDKTMEILSFIPVGQIVLAFNMVQKVYSMKKANRLEG